MKVSWQRVVAFSRFVNGFQVNGENYPGWLVTHPEESKLSYAMKRVLDQIPALDKVKQVEFENIDIDHCATGEGGVILRNPDGSIAFTREGLKARNLARTALLESEVEIASHYCIELPSLLEQEREILGGFVIQPTSELEMVA